MPIEIDTSVNEGGTLFVTAAFIDEEGASIAPHTLTWTLTNKKGNVINDRENVPIDTPGESETVVLTGDDLVLAHDADDFVILQFRGLYDSDIEHDLVIIEEAEIPVTNITYPNRDD